MAGSNFLRARSPVIPKTTRAQGSGTRGSRRSRGSRSGLVIMSVLESRGRRPARRRAGRRGTCAELGLLLQLVPDRVGELVPGVDELLHALVLEDLEDVVEVDAGVRDGLQHGGRVVVGLLHRGAGLA